MDKNSPAHLKKRIEKLAGLPAISAAAHAAGDCLYLVGGAVRDTVLGVEVNDIDLATTGPFEKTAAVLAGAFQKKGILLGRPQKPTYRFVLPGLIVDLSPAEGGNIESDLRRRDLTINAMALELRPGEARIIDPWDGLGDLDNRVARFVSPEVVLADPLRLLRLFRFSADLGLIPHPASLAVVKTHAALIKDVPGERIREELLKLLAVPNISPTVNTMLDCGLLMALMPELEPLRHCDQNHYHHLNVLDHSMLALSCLEEIMAESSDYFPEHVSEIQAYLRGENRTALLKLISLLHDLGKPQTRSEEEDGRLHFYRHEDLGEKLAGQIAARFRLTKNEKSFIQFIVRHHLRVFHLLDAEIKGNLTSKGIYRFGRMAGPDLWAFFLHALADAQATQGPASQIRESGPNLGEFFLYLHEQITKQKQQLPRLISGRDLMETFDLPSSPLLGRILTEIEEAQAIGRIKTRSEALDYAKKMIE